jgi:hypothetical protein
MFVTKKAHDELIRTLHEQYGARIAQMEDSISDLRRLVFSPTSATNIPLVHLEADAVISQKEEVMEVDPSESEKFEFLTREADRIFSGNYDEAG